MAIYDLSAHPLLSGKVKELDGPEFEAQALLAEGLLGLPATPYTGRAGALAASAVAMQINWQVEYGADPYVFTERNAPVHRTNSVWKDEVPLVDPRAKQLADQAAIISPAGVYRGLRSIRGPQV